MVSADNHLHVKHTCNVCTTHASTSVVSFIIINAPSARVVSFKVVIEILSKRSYFTNTLWSHDRGKSISMFVGNTKISPWILNVIAKSVDLVSYRVRYIALDFDITLALTLDRVPIPFFSRFAFL